MRVGDNVGQSGIVVRRAHAKLNLALSVGPTDAKNGLHPIASWFVCVGLCDEVEVRKLGEIGSGVRSEARVVCSADGPCRVGLGESGDVDWPVDSDLAVRSHRALEAHVGASLPAFIEVRKRIPAGGGLGGGSSDAAAVLIALDEAFGLELSDAQLAEVGACVGSDVPFFVDRAVDHCGVGQTEEDIAARPAIVEGFGERIERTGRVFGGVLLIVPGFGCPTGPVYKAFDASGSGVLDPGRVRRAVSASVQHGAVDDRLLFNDLAAAAIAVQSELGDLRELVSSAIGRRVHVTGSGSTLFVVCEDFAEARSLVSSLHAVMVENNAPEWARRCDLVPTALV